MIKINLLPKSIGQSTLSQVTAGICALFLVLVVGGLLGYYHTVMVPKTEKMEKMAADAAALKLTVQDLQAQAAAQDALVVPIQAKITFVNDVIKFNGKYPDLFEKVARWTYDQVVYSSMSTSGGTLTMNARAQSLEDLGRYLLNMYRATDMFTSVSISNVPSYPGISAVPNNGRGPIIQTPLDFTVTCQLTSEYVFTPPSAPTGGSSAPASPSASGMGAGMPGASGGAMPGMGMGMGPGAKGMGAGMPGAGGGAMPGMGMGMGPGAKGMGAGMPGASGGAMPGMGMGMGPGAKSPAAGKTD